MTRSRSSGPTTSPSIATAVILTQEQDKHSLGPGAAAFGDRSPGLWRTLQIWKRQRAAGIRSGAVICWSRTRWRAGSVADAVRGVAAGSIGADEAVGPAARGGGLQSAFEDADHDRRRAGVDRRRIDGPRRPHGDRGPDGRTGPRSGRPWPTASAWIPASIANLVVENMLGWVTSELIGRWRRGLPGIVTPDGLPRPRRPDPAQHRTPTSSSTRLTRRCGRSRRSGLRHDQALRVSPLRRGRGRGRRAGRRAALPAVRGRAPPPRR